jgi:hypothetical protein
MYAFKKELLSQLLWKHNEAISMDIEERMNLVLRNTEETVTPDELRILLETKTKPRAYWGFESSG